MFQSLRKHKFEMALDVFLILFLSLSLLFLRLDEVPPRCWMKFSPSTAEITPHHMATDKNVLLHISEITLAAML